jgi:hypothetical protein
MSAARKPLDFSDPAAVRAWLADLYARVDDIDAVILDMFAPPEERDFGPVYHRRFYEEARGAILDAFRFAGFVTEPESGEVGANDQHAGAPTDPDATPTEPGELDADEPPWAPGGKP